MATSGFTVNGIDIVTPAWPDKSYLIDRYPELTNTFKQAGLWLSGYNLYGQLGNATSGAGTDRSSPIQTFSGGTNWKQVTGGWYFNTAIKTDGTMYGWGLNTLGQLGIGNTSNAIFPVQVSGGGNTWKQAAAGGYHTLAIKTDGTLWTSGYNSQGQLGIGNITNQSVTTQIAGTNWKQAAGGLYHSLAIKTDGTLWAWGMTTSGQLGNGNNFTPYSSPVQTNAGGTNWKLVAAGDYHSGAIKTDGTLWMWGSAAYGMLGEGAVASRSSPVQTSVGGTNWKSMSCGRQHTAAIKTDGTLWMWGDNSFGALGDGTNTNAVTPIQTIAGGTTWKQVSRTALGTMAIKTDGTLWAWGYNGNGQLMTGNTVYYSSPVQTIAGGTNWKSVGGSMYTPVAIRDDSADPI